MKNKATWTYNIKGIRTPGVSQMLVHENLVFIAVHYAKAGFYEGKLLCLSLNTGELHWEFVTDNVINSKVSVSGDQVYVAAFDGYVYGLNLADGQLRWKFHTGKNMFSSPAVVGDKLICCETHAGNFTYCLDRHSGQKIWELKTGVAVASSPVVYKDLIFHGSNSPLFFAIDLNTGIEKWRYEADGYFAGSPNLFGDQVITGCLNGALYVFEPFTGQIVTQFQTGGAIYRKPIIENKHIFIGNEAGVFSSLTASSQSISVDWTYQIPEIISTNACIANGQVLFGSADGHVYCLDKEDGALIDKKNMKSIVRDIMLTDEFCLISADKGQLSAFEREN